MYRFEYCSTTLESSFDLPALPGFTGRSESIDRPIRIVVDEQDVPLIDCWTHRWTNRSSATLAVGRAGERYVIQVGDRHSYLYEARSHTVTLTSQPTPVHHNELLNQVLPRVLDHEGRFLIHGSAVEVRHSAVSFVGASGWGKSTLVAALHSAGASPLSDDCMEFLIERDTAFCRSTYQSLRLWQDSAEAVPPGDSYRKILGSGEKQRFHPRVEAAADDLPLAVIYLLTDPDQPVDEVGFEPLAPARAVSELLKHSFRLDPSDEARARTAFDSAVDLVQRVPTFLLAYPRDYGRLGEVTRAIVDHAALSDSIRPK